MRPQEFPSIEAERDALRRENSELRTIAQMLVDRLYGKKSERSEKPPDKKQPPRNREPEKTEDSGHGRAAFPEQHPRETTTTATYAYLAVCKFGDHIPFDRLEGILKRQGIHLPKSTMGDMVQVVAEKGRLILAQCQKEMLAASHLQMDETPLTVVAEEGHGTKRGYLWVYRARIGPLGHPATIEMVLMEFHFSRGKAVPCGILRDFRGTLQTDGYAGYDEVVKNLGLLRAGCWSHCRRPWKAAEDHGSVEATKMIGLMQGLWRLEGAIQKWIRKKGLDPDQARELIRRARAKTSTRIVGRIAAYKAELLQDPSILPKSHLGKALTYMKNQWETLLVFLSDPDVELDTNASERAIRNVAIGRNNWRVAGSPRGARVAADLFSLIGMCKSLNIDPHEYLTDVLERVSPHADLAALTPWAWAQAKRRSTVNTN